MITLHIQQHVKEICCQGFLIALYSTNATIPVPGIYFKRINDLLHHYMHNSLFCISLSLNIIKKTQKKRKKKNKKKSIPTIKEDSKCQCSGRNIRNNVLF